MFLKVKNLKKSYGSAAVLKGVDLEAQSGSVLAFLGANGAGKSTLLGCICGAQDADTGDILIGEKSLRGLMPREVQDHGVAMIYQHSQAFEDLSVTENIFLGREIKIGQRINHSAQKKIALELLTRLGVDNIDPSVDLKKLGVGERKIVEIARALMLKPKFLILDEPTASLSDKEAKALHKVIQQAVTNECIGVIYVTHFLDEIHKVANKVTILRDGKILWTQPVEDVSIEDLSDAISPNNDLTSFKSGKNTRDHSNRLVINDLKTSFVGPINFSLTPGEILGIYGLMGSGRTELLECLAGASTKKEGTQSLNGKEKNYSSPRSALSDGIALVASDRKEQSLFSSFTAVENLVIPHLGQTVFSGFFRSFEKEKHSFEKVAKLLNIQPPDPNLQGQRFSGGNAQKIMVGRWLIDDSGLQVLLLDEPTQGVDIGARFELYQALVTLKQSGVSIIVASSDATEVCQLSDKVLILGRGQQVALIDNPHSEEHLIKLAHKAEHNTQNCDAGLENAELKAGVMQ
ncbi:sugar ABC transporter ATP-binding protein [Pelagibaculum spongiae]|uniref:Autoinducer 2 import ATP-binding protein LsrA n=1 Tax=Pelagibaculum spongiae TaxID=2080658 RepID=A0A2V1GWS2_9GAMM|nr:sugar ABC transporter ATP-binding protein [Pelagibaculum spongiae]PVZ65479.1 hypothetical protein DC094_18550 [Pelagibaculum spongiae]